jgi:hypothetical protein
MNKIHIPKGINDLPKKSVLILLHLILIGLIEDSNETEYKTFIQLLDAYESEKLR